MHAAQMKCTQVANTFLEENEEYQSSLTKTVAQSMDLAMEPSTRSLLSRATEVEPLTSQLSSSRKE